MAVSGTKQSKTVSVLSSQIETADPQKFLSSFFSIPAFGGVHNQDEVEYDGQVEDKVAATPVPNSASDYNWNDFSGFDTTKVEPPVYKEGVTIPASKLGDLQVGQNIYQNVNFQQNGARLVGQSIVKLQNKIRRATEIQASQLLTTGKMDILSGASETAYEIDYGIDSGNFFDAGVAWSSSTATAYADIKAACALIPNPTAAIMDSDSFDAALKNDDDFTSRFKFPQPGTGLGVMRPGTPQSPFGKMYMGSLVVGGQRIDIWVYDEGVKLYPGATSETKFLVKKCVVLNDTRRDATFGGIPTFAGAAGSQRALNIPTRFTNRSNLFDMSVNSYILRNETLVVGIGTRPLLIPRTKTGFACISTLLA